MRIGLLWAAAWGAMAVAVGCGGKVVVDLNNGAGGSGGTTATGTGTATNTITGVTCGDTGCSVGSDGSCQCDGVCNAQKLTVSCAPIQGGASCDCVENGIKIAVCIQPGSASCGFLTECCAAEFFGQSGTGGG